MGNLSITPAIPASDNTGLPSAVSALGLEKTIYVDGVFSGAVIVEASNGMGYVPIASFTAPGRKIIPFAAQDIRIVRKGGSGTPAVTVSSNDDGGLFAELAVGSPGASSDLRSFGTYRTIIADIGADLLTFTGVAVDTQTVTIGSKTYTFQTVLTNVDGNVLIGANQAASVANLIAAINLAAGSGSTYAAATTANTDVQANVGSTTAIMEAKLLDGSGSNNGIAATETLTNASWSSATIGKFMDGVVQVQTSEDDAVWTDLCSFQGPDEKTLEVTARYMRVNHVNNTLGSTPRVSVGAINDDTAHKPDLQTLVSAANVAWDASLGTKALLILGENLTVDNPINVEPGMVLDIVMQQDGTGGRTAAYGSAWEWPGGTNPVITVAIGAQDTIRGVVHAVSAAGVATQIHATFAQAFAV